MDEPQRNNQHSEANGRPMNSPPIPSCQCHQPNGQNRGRKLIVALDGTSNQFGTKNTNVVELYARIEKVDGQHTYYNSGIGTYAKPSWRSWSYWKTIIENKIDLALAWNFEKIVMGGYRWLSENYRDGDQIFIFGFSRGAYQARVLAGMIERVGLIFPGNEEQIPFAYNLYADSDADNTSSKDHTQNEETYKLWNTFWPAIQRGFSWLKPVLSKLTSPMDHHAKLAKQFKDTFSRPNVRVHFVGVWDTVSSVGIGRSRTLPLAHEHEHICLFRHALALDECRVKFLPEYIHGGDSTPRGGISLARNDDPGAPGKVSSRSKDHGFDSNTRDTSRSERAKMKTQPRVKEVWFAGSHSDVGGGIKINENLDLGDVPSLWMGNEAMMAGLKLKESKVEWDWKELKTAKPSGSLTGIWWLVECLPLTRLTYRNSTETTRSSHMAQPRVIRPGQLIHASVAFKLPEIYQPKAVFSAEMEGKSWDAIIGKGRQDDLDWASNLTDILELDLLDHSQVESLIAKLRRKEGNTHDFLKRLSHLALYDAGIRAIVAAENGSNTLIDILDSGDSDLKFTSAVVLYRIAGSRWSRNAFNASPAAEVLGKIASDPTSQIVQLVVTAILARLSYYWFWTNIHTINDKQTHKLLIQLPKTSPIEFIAQSLKSEEANVQEFASQALCFVAEHGNIREKILQTDAIGSFAMILKSSVGDLQISGAEALYQLIEYDDMRGMILETDVITSLASMLKSPIREVQDQSVQVLSSLANYDVIRGKIIKTDAITSLVKMLDSQDNYGQSWAAVALTRLADYDDIREELLTIDAIGTFARALNSTAHRAQESGAFILSTLAKHNDLREAILSNEAIFSLAGSVQKEGPSQPVHPVANLWELVTNGATSYSQRELEVFPNVALETDADVAAIMSSN